MRLFVLLISISIIFTGCLSIPMQTKFTSPKESLYFHGNRYYEESNFEKAIEYYNKFLEEIPNSELSIPGKLNLGMSYYYTKDYKNAYETLKDIELTDSNLKEYVQKIVSVCEGHVGEILEKESQAQAKESVKKGLIRISIIDAYIDSRDLVILGKTDKPASLKIDGEAVTLKGDNTFKAEISWKKGKSVLLIAEDENNNAGELKFFPDSEPPEEPEGLQVLNTSNNSIEIGWDENSEKDVIGYKIYYRLKGSKLHEVRDIIDDDRYEEVGLSNYVEGANRTFQFYIRAVDKMLNESDDSDILEVDLP